MSFPMRRKLQVLQIKQVPTVQNLYLYIIIYQNNKFQQKEGSIGTGRGKN